jgi:hypothetical protein
MYKNTFIAVFLLLATLTTAFAADVTGHWTGRINDQFDVAYDFKVDGEKLTGSTQGPDGTAIQIKDGIIKGDDLTFTLEIMGNNLKIKGKVSGDVMKLTFTMEGNEIPFELKKS